MKKPFPPKWQAGWLLFLLCGLLAALPGHAQTYLISTSPGITTCAGTIYDSGGANGNYGNFENFTTTLTPATAGNVVRLAFSSFATSAFDNLTIYDGASASAPLLGTFTGNTSPGTITATNATGQLTLVFFSFFSTPDAGFAAAISCVAPVPAPTISSFSPTSGPAGTSVVITGTNFTGATAVRFNGTTAPGFVVNSATQITVPVPAGAPNGPLTVTTQGTATSAASFTTSNYLISTSPGITTCAGTIYDSGGLNGDYGNFEYFTTTLTPATAGNVVRLAFSSFATSAFDNLTIYDGASASAPLLGTFTGNTSPGTITATNATGQLTLVFSSLFSPAAGFAAAISCVAPVPAPTISSFSPTSGPAGTSVVITGTNFTGATAVRFNGTTAPGFVVNSATQITVPVPAGAPNGPLTVTTQGTATSAASFTTGNYLISTSPGITTCAGTIYDSGGLNGDYGNYENFTTTLTPATAGNVVRLVFSAFATENFYDNLTIYDGANASAPLLGTFTGNTSPGTITATNATGQLTLVFSSDSYSTDAGFAAAISCVAPVPAPTISSFSPTSGPAGTSVVITGTNFTGATAVRFNGTTAPGFVVNSATQITVPVPAGAPNGPLTVTTQGGTATSAASFTTGNYLISINASITTCAGTIYDSGGLNGNYGNFENFTTTLTPATAGNVVRLVFSAFATSTFDNLTIYDGASASAPLLGTFTGNTSPGTITATNATGQLTLVFSSLFSTPAAGFAAAISCVAPADLTVVNGQSLTAGGLYNNIVVQNGGILTLTGPTIANGTLTVQSGGILATNCQTLAGPASFTLQAGAELQICDVAGITNSGATGAIQVTGTRTYASDASYTYNGTAAQTTGAGLPGTVRNLTVNNTTGLTLSQAVRIAQVARLQSGNLATGGQGFTLLSAAAGTALVDNTGGVVTGTGTMQRAVTNALTGPAYRHFSSPVAGTTLADLTTTGFAPTFNIAYNSSATPSLVTPFPTVFGYDQARIATVTSTYGAFDKGWFSPAGSGDVMQPTRGYTVNAPATATPIDFVGSFNNAAQNSGTLSRGTDAQAGWQLLGNPYPAPLDWNTVAAGQRPGMDGAMYVYQSTGQYAGSYRSFDNGVGASPLIDAGSGYFARVTTPGGSGSVNLTNANRVTTFGAEPAFGRGTDTRPQLHLLLNGAGITDETFLYMQTGATANVDAEYDAIKLANPAGLDLASLSGTESLAINGLAPLTRTDVVVPLLVRTPQTGTFSFEVAGLTNFGATTVYLRDALTGTQQPLVAGTRYSFSLASATAGNGRFSVVFRAANVTATLAGLDAASVSLYPNPAHSSFTVLLPPLAGQREVHATLLNALGQVVLTRTIGLTAAGATAEFNTQLLATGVYTLRLQAENQALTKRVVIK